MMDIKPRFLGTIVAMLFAAVLGGCSANGTSGGTNAAGASGVSHIKLAPVVTLAISPSHLNAGGAVTVTWSSTAAVSCVGTGALSGALTTNQDTGLSVNLDNVGTWTFGIVCTGLGGTAAATQLVTVGAIPAPTIDFAVGPNPIAPNNVAYITWSASNADSCSASGGTGSDGWQGTLPTERVSPFITPVFTAIGNYTYNITCTGAGGTTTATQIEMVTPSAPAAPPQISFSASPNQISPGDSTSFAWTSLNATACTASGGSGADGWSGNVPTASSGTTVGPVATSGSYAYTLTCLGAGGSAAQTLTVLVSPPNVTINPLVAIDVSPASIVVGQSANLSWSTANADSCVASGNWAGGQSLLGSLISLGNFALAGNYTYTLTCTGPSGSAAASATLVVAPGVALISIFTANPTTVTAGGSTSLSWATTGATSCSASGGAGSSSWNGTVPTSGSGVSDGPLNVPGTYTYTLICQGPGGASAPQSVNVTVAPATPVTPSITAFAATPATITAGQAASLAWNSSNATSCTGTGGTGTDGWSGSVGTSSSGTSTGPITVPGSYTYRLTCAGPGGTSTPASTVVNVNAAPGLPATVSVFTASPSNIQVGQSATLAWVSIGASSCTASGGTGSWGGSVATTSNGTSTGVISTAGTYTYTLTCNGSGGTGTPASVTVNVSNPPGAAAAVTAFTATPTTVAAGGYTSLAWTTSNATACTAAGGAGSDGWTGSVGTASAGTLVGPLNSAGSVTYILNCTGMNGPGAPSSATVNVVSALPLPAVSSFTATPSTIQTGQNTSLTWTSTGATSCTASGGTGSDNWTGPEAAAGTVSVGPLNTAGTYTYTLTCAGPGGTGTANSTVVNVNAVTPPAATVTSLTAVPGTVLVGQSSALTWTSDSATACAASGGGGAAGWSGSVGTTGVAHGVGPFTTAGTYTFTLTCSGSGGTGAPTAVSIDVTTAATPAVIGTFAALPTSVTTGTPVTLNWVTLGATSCTASGGTTSDNWGGSVATSNVAFVTAALTPAGTYTYTLTCTGAGGSSAPDSVAVTVTDAPMPPTIEALAATPNAVQTGGSTLLSWTAIGATSCTASGGVSGDGWSGPVATTQVGTSIGPITPAGTYTYTLTCMGAGGTSTSNQTVTATNAIPPANVVTFTALPTTINTGQSVLLNWVTAGATACTASGGTGTDGWRGSKPTSGVATTVGPINTAGVYGYTLNCTGPGGASTPSSVTVTVNTATPPASVTAITAAPSTVQVGQSSSLAWTTLNATSCTATGGTGSDGWSGPVAANSVSKTVGPFTSAGTVTYTLTCTGTGGTGSPSSTNITVNAATPVQPTVSLTVNGNNPATVQPGATPTLAWTSSNATLCTATGGTGTDGWPGVKSTSSTGVTIGALNTPGSYSYTLTCTGAGGTGTSTAQVTVIASSTSNCGLPSLPTTALLMPTALDSFSIETGVCVGCSVTNPTYPILQTEPGPATLTALLGLAGGGTLQYHVKDTSTTYPAGRQAGFTISEGNQVLSLNLLGNVQISTYLNNALQETATSNNHLLGLQAVGALSVAANAGFAGFTTTKSFNEISIEVTEVAGLLTAVDVYRACVSLQ